MAGPSASGLYFFGWSPCAPVFGRARVGPEGRMSATMDPTHESRDTQFMEMALPQAEAAVRAGQAPFGAVVVDRDGTVIGEGYNRVRADVDPTAHGEIVAIRAAWRQVGDWAMLAGGALSFLLLRHRADGIEACRLRGACDGRARPSVAAGRGLRRGGRLGECAGRLAPARRDGRLHARARPEDHVAIPVGAGRNEGSDRSIVVAADRGATAGPSLHLACLH